MMKAANRSLFRCERNCHRGAGEVAVLPTSGVVSSAMIAGIREVHERYQKFPRRHDNSQEHVKIVRTAEAIDKGNSADQPSASEAGLRAAAAPIPS